MGLGNETFFSTEIEEDGGEYRVPKFIKPNKISDRYLRFWIGKRVFILSTRDGFKISKRDRNKLKLVFGIAGDL